MIADEEIGRAVARLRGDRPQREIAERMRDLGWRWSQNTVWKVESGERPLRLAEAVDLEFALGGQILGDDPQSVALRAAERWLATTGRDLRSAARNYEEARAEFHRAASGFPVEIPDATQYVALTLEGAENVEHQAAAER